MVWLEWGRVKGYRYYHNFYHLSRKGESSVFLKTVWPPLVTKDFAGAVASPPVPAPLMIRQQAARAPQANCPTHHCNLITCYLHTLNYETSTYLAQGGYLWRYAVEFGLVCTNELASTGRSEIKWSQGWPPRRGDSS